jgi:hypothetical protein
MYMSVTSEVSKLSGWLKAYACCRVEGGGVRCGASAGREAGGRGAVAAQAASTGKARGSARGQGTRGAHVEHVAHARDLGGVKAQRLVEGVRVLPSRRGGGAMRGECEPREAGGRGAVAAQAASTGKARLKAWEGRRARAERTENM